MNKYLRLILFTITFIVGIKMAGAGEDSVGEANIFDGIKAQLISSSEEYKRLADENKTLKAQLISLQLEVEQYERQIEQLDPGYVENSKLLRKKGKKSNGWSDPESDALVQEAQNIYLSGRAMPIDDVQRLRELHLYDLQYQKQDLELELKSLKFLQQKVEKKRYPELDALKKEIDENTAKTQSLSARIARQQKAALDYPREIELLRLENNSLKMRIDQLKGLLK